MPRKYHKFVAIFSFVAAFCALLAQKALCENTVPVVKQEAEAVKASVPDGAQKKEAQTQGEILTRLPNGLLVYIIRDTRFPLACSRLYCRVGSANEKPSQAGISHVLEHMVFKGTAHRPKGQVAKDVETLGGYLNAATSFDKTWYITDMPAAHWRVGMDVVKDMAFQATLDPAELEAEKEVVISELQRGKDSPMRDLYENMQVAALKNTPYGRPIIGYENTIRSLTVQDLKDYVRLWYQPQNMMLLVAGDINPDEVLDYAQKLFGDLRNHSDLAVPEPLDLRNAAQDTQTVEIKRGPWNKVYLGIALPVPGYDDLRSIDLDVLAYLLGGDGTSTFYQKYKYDLQLVDSINVGNMSLARAGLFTITAQLESDKAQKFWEEITKDLATLSGKFFGDQALARAKFNIEDSMDRAGETLNGLASWRGTVQFDLGGKQGEENLRFTQNNVDQSQLQNVIDHWLDSRQARVRVMAPEKAELPDFNAIMNANWPRKESAVVDVDEKMAVKESAEVVDLGKGRIVVLLPDDSAPYVSLDFLMPGGNSMLKPSQQGLANLTARMLTDGCGDLNNLAMEKWFSERAASVSASSGLQTFGVSLTGPSRFNDDYFTMLHDILRRPRIDPAELRREVENMKSALKQRNDQPLAFMFSKLSPFLFPGGQPYGYDNLGDAQSLDSFNVTNVRDFWTIQSGQPWALAVAGKFDREKVLRFAKGLPEPRENKFTAAVPRWNEGDRNLNLTLPGRNQAHYLRIFRTVPISDPDAPALMLLQAALSGQSGPLFTQLRDEQGLGYTVTAFNRSMPQAGFMAFYIGTTPEKLEQAREGFTRIIHSLKDAPLPEETLKASSNRLLGDYLRDRQSLASRAGEAATDVVLAYPQNFQKMLIEKAADLTPADIQAVARKYLVNSYEATLLP